MIQPVDVCASDGTGCAPFCSTKVNSASTSPSSVCVTNPSTAIASTPIGFVDPATTINNTRAIWLQAGIDVTFLPIQQYNSPANSAFPPTDYRTLHVSCTATSCASPDFETLSQGLPSGFPSPAPPVAPTAANEINMFFVNTLVAGAGASSPLFGFAWLNGNGIAVAKNAFFPPFPVTPRFDTLAHEIGHNLGCDHTTCGNFVPGSSPPVGFANNVMTAGSSRTVPVSSGCSPSTTNGGALFDLNVPTIFPCSMLPMSPIADQLLSTQQSAVLGPPSSGFLNPNANLSATAGGGDFPFELDFVSDGRPGESFVEFDLSLPKGFEFCNNLFTLTSTNGPQVFGTPQVVQDNSQGNSNSQGDQGNSNVLQVVFERGTFTVGKSIRFMTDICNENTGQLVTNAPVLECTTPSTTKCMNATFKTDDLHAVTSDFGPSGTASTQFPNATVPSVIFDANTVPSLAGTGLTFTGFTQIPCTPPSLEATTFAASTLDPTSVCPPLAGGDPTGPD